MLAVASRALWPLFVAASLAGFAGGFELGHGAVSLFAVPALAVVALLGLEPLLPAAAASPDGRGQGALRDPQFWNDVAHNLFSQGFGNELGRVLFLFAAAALAGHISETAGGNLWPAIWPFWIQVPLLVLLADGLDYFRHRLIHTVPWLWPMHALHHSTDRMNVLKSGRGHFLDMVFRALVVYAPLVVVGVPAEVLLWYPAAVAAFGPIAHSDLHVRLPSWLHRLVLTPHVHRIHHARDLALAMSNYANVFPLWDILFGSFQHPDHHPSPEFGIEGDPMPRSLAGQLLAPFVWRRLGRESIERK